MGLFEVNPRLLPPKAHYFLYFGGVAAFFPFVAVFGKQLGFQPPTIGALFTACALLAIVANPFFGLVADKFKIKRKLFLFFNILNLIAILCFALLPSIGPKQSRPVTIECGTGATFLRHCHDISTSSGRDSWNSSLLSAKVRDEAKSTSRPAVCYVSCDVNGTEAEEFCENMFKEDRFALGSCTDGNYTSMNGTQFVWTFTVEPAFNETMPLEYCIYADLGVVTRFVEFTEGKKVEHEPNTRLSCSPRTKLSSCQLNCPTFHEVNSAMTEGEESGGKVSTFVLYATFTVITWVALAVVTAVADALCFQTLGDRPDHYGQQRVWGAVGWGLFTLAAGFFVDLISGDAIDKNYAPCFWISGLMLAVNVYVCWKWEVKEEERPKALGRRIVALLLEPKIAVFILACIIVGICTGLLWNFLFWYIEDLAKERMSISATSLKWIKLLQGLISFVQCFCGEVPFFFLAGKFINRFGHVNCMTIVIGSFGVRFLLYSILDNPWWVLPIELFQGLTYGIFYTNMATYAYTVSPEGTAATVQGIVASAFEGVGVGIGSLMGGFMFEAFKGRSTFRWYGIFALLMSVVYKGVMMTIDRKFEPLPQNPGNDYLGTELKRMQKEVNGN